MVDAALMKQARAQEGINEIASVVHSAPCEWTPATKRAVVSESVESFIADARGLVVSWKFEAGGGRVFLRSPEGRAARHRCPQKHTNHCLSQLGELRKFSRA